MYARENDDNYGRPLRLVLTGEDHVLTGEDRVLTGEDRVLE